MQGGCVDVKKVDRVSPMLIFLQLAAASTRQTQTAGLEGLIFVSVAEPSSPSTIRNPHISLTLHESGQTTGSIPLQPGSGKVSARMSYSTADHRVIIVVAGRT